MRLLLLLPLLLAPLQAADIVAASASQADVSTAVGLASDGDTVLIPNGSSTWTSGIATTKQIIIRAQNYTATPAGTSGSGASSRNVTITNNSSTPLFDFTSGSDYHCGVGGIAFEEGTQSTNYIEMGGTGTKPPLVFDCWFEVGQRNGSAAVVCAIDWQSTGGVIWNCVLTNNGLNGAGAGGTGADGASFHVKSSQAWTTSDTLGDNDTGGTTNLYIEDCTFIQIGQCPDVDDNGRVVIRGCLFDGTSGLTHGFTSALGGRHVELYGNTFQQTYNDRNNSRYFWMRAGTGVFTDNLVEETDFPGAYGTLTFVDMGDNMDPTTLGTYPLDRQPGGGHNGTSYIVDPIRIYGNTENQATSWDVQGGGWDAYIVEDRDFYYSADDTDARSGWSKYTYPHPFRDLIETAASLSLSVDSLTIGP